MNGKTTLLSRSSFIGFLLALLLALAGCRGTPTPSLTPTPTEAAGLPGTRTPAPAETRAPAVLTATAEAATQTPGPSPTGPTVTPGGPTATQGEPAAQPTAQPVAEAGEASPTPGECQIPAGWVVYTILPGDTLSYLAQVTGSTVEEIRAGNCLEGDDLVAYEILHLPRRPPAPVVVAPGQGGSQPLPPEDLGQNADECASIFSCANPDLPVLTIPVGGAGGGWGEFCVGDRDGPWIDALWLSAGDTERDVYIGRADYYYACGFSGSRPLTAWISGQGITEDLPVEETVMVGCSLGVCRMLDIPAGQKVFTWYPACWLKAGSYTLSISDGSATARLALNLIHLKNRIMVKPQVLQAGEEFDIYYCGFDDYAGKLAPIDLLRYKDDNWDNSNVSDWDPSMRDWAVGVKNYDLLRSWEVPINQASWYQQRQFVAADTPANEYVVAPDTPAYLYGSDGPISWAYFWVVP